MSDASMAEAEEAGDPMMQSPRDGDGATASGPNVAALRDALEAPVEFTDLKVRYLKNTLCSIRTNSEDIFFRLHGWQKEQCSWNSGSAHSLTKASWSMQDPVGNRVTVSLKDGRSWRIALPLRPTHLLPNLALDALCQALKPPMWHALLSNHLLCPGEMQAFTLHVRLRNAVQRVLI